MILLTELLKEIKKELFGTEVDGQATEDGFLIKLRAGKYDSEQYERLYKLFGEVNKKIVEKDEVAAETLAYYTEFVKVLFGYIDKSEDPKLSNIKDDLVGLFGK